MGRLYYNCDRNIKFSNYGLFKVSNSFLRPLFLKLLYYASFLIPLCDIILIKLGQKRPKSVSAFAEIRSKHISNETLK